jgi:3-oxoacyl-[acyl-carrier protein] reductase
MTKPAQVSRNLPSLLKGKTAVVVGKTSFALAATQALADYGCRTAVVCEPGAEGVLPEITTDGGVAAVAITLDLASRTQVMASLEKAARELSGLDIVVHALFEPDWILPAAIADTDEAAWRSRCEGQIRSAMLVGQAAFAQLREKGGRLIYVIPTEALTGAELGASYAAGAEGIRGLAKSAARQWGSRGILVNIVAVPAVVLAMGASSQSRVTASARRSAWAPALGRMPNARKEVGAVIAFLASDLAGFLTGNTIVVDGGTLMQ